jgi:peroxiredoxin
LDPKGKEIVLSSLTASKPTVLVFYRGGWCPYCNRHLAALAEMEQEILDLGFQIIAISPDDCKNLSSTLDVDKVNYQIYADPGGKFIQDLGIAFSANDRTKEYISKKTKGKVTEILPVPTILIINTEGDILFEYINPNYTNRISGKLLLSVLIGLLG